MLKNEDLAFCIVIETCFQVLCNSTVELDFFSTVKWSFCLFISAYCHERFPNDNERLIKQAMAEKLTEVAKLSRPAIPASAAVDDNCAADEDNWLK